MKIVLEQLLKLQNLDLVIRRLGHDLQQIPKKNRAIDEKIRDVKEPFDAASSEIADLESKGGPEAGLRKLEEKERQLKLKMPEIRTNEEYSALLKEMDATKKEREVLEDSSLRDMERLDELKASLEGLKSALDEGEEKVAAERAEIQAEKERLETGLLQAKKERQALQAAMHQGWFRKYNAIAAQRNGIAVVAVKGGTCQGCYMGVRPKTVQDLQYGEEVLFCEGCQRVLFLEDAAPAN